MNEANSEENELIKLRAKAEEKLKEKKENPAKKFVRDIHFDLTVYEMELKMQNEELLSIQAKLATSLKEYAELFEFSPVGYFILDVNGGIEKVNERGCALLGIDKTHLIGKPFSIFIDGESHQDNFYRYRNLLVESEKMHRLESEIKRKDGSVFSALIKSVIIKDENHAIKHLLSIVTDISALKENERQTDQALKKERELNAMKSRFIAMASHEFRTPLSSVLSSTSLIEEYAKLGQLDKMEKHFKRIKSSVKDLTTILDDFLSIEKLESGKVEVVNHKIDIIDFCEDMVEEISCMLKKGQKITISHSGDNFLQGDKKIIRHILLNLLSNASKYSDEDKEIQFITEYDGKKLSIKIVDQGIGIPENEQKLLFSRFFRAQNAADVQGTGLGLNIVRKYLQLIGGTISFISVENKGTTFMLEIPIETKL